MFRIVFLTEKSSYLFQKEVPKETIELESPLLGLLKRKKLHGYFFFQNRGTPLGSNVVLVVLF